MNKALRILSTGILPCVLLLLAAARAEAAPSITLTWNPNTEVGLTHYVVSYGAAPGQTIQTLNTGLSHTWTITVPDYRTYYFRVKACTAQACSSNSNEVSGAAVVVTERIAIGLSNQPGNGGWLAAINGAGAAGDSIVWKQLPSPEYNATGGGVRLAAGDVDGDGLDELVVGLASGGNGRLAVFDDAVHGFAFLKWIQVSWPTYNAANGEVWPAVGDLDGDGRDEIVAGLGAGGGGWFEIFDDAATGYASLGWHQVDWPTYNAGPGPTHPAIGNVDGIGASEIIVGLGTGGNGYIEVFNGSTGNYAHRSWMRVDWLAYDAANGSTFPAAGDLDGDGRAEIVAGLGSGGGGWLPVFEATGSSYGILRWLRTSWADYNALGSGETHPAVGNIDGDSLAEIVVGLDVYPGAGGWVEMLDDELSSNGTLGWRNLDWGVFTAAGGGTFPAIGKFR